ncbi:MAG: hypothetical protein KDG55_08285 [Rhodocyclaceae bacterium]|nr:hypothetical protein [Rhodocyclaceae bacterium]
MKIDQLPIGARFLLKGRVFTKVGPMTAAGDNGGTTFVPKHAVLQPLPGEAAPPSPLPDRLEAARVLAAIEAYHQQALALVGEAGREPLEAAHRALLARLA